MKLPYDIDDPALARATWARLAKPNSATAAMVVGRLGPGPALKWLLWIVIAQHRAVCKHHVHMIMFAGMFNPCISMRKNAQTARHAKMNQ